MARPRKHLTITVVRRPNKLVLAIASRSEQIVRIAGSLGMSTQEDVLVTAVDLLARAVDLAEEHGKDKVKIGVPKKFSLVFAEPDDQTP